MASLSARKDLAQEVAKWCVCVCVCVCACAHTLGTELCWQHVPWEKLGRSGGEAGEGQWAESAFSYWPEAQHLLDLELSGPRAGWFHVYGPEIESGIWLPKEQRLPSWGDAKPNVSLPLPVSWLLSAFTWCLRFLSPFCPPGRGSEPGPPLPLLPWPSLSGMLHTFLCALPGE